MRAYWDDAARRNAAWYVDTSLDYDHPDMTRFFATGQTIVTEALDRGPVAPAGSERAVEIGSGLGRICLALADRFEAVVGVDISPEMVSRALSLVDRDGVTFALGDGVTLPLPDASADLVLSFTVFQHIPKVSVIEGYIHEAGRILRPGGAFVFQWNNEPGAIQWRTRRLVLGALQRLGVHAERYQRHAPEFLGSRVPQARIERALDAAGLRLVETRGAGSLYAWAWAVRPE
jgi:SAM-dependent methyltransferase